MKLVNKQSVFNVVPSPVKGLHHAEVDGAQITPPMSYKDLTETLMILTAEGVSRILPVYHYNPQAYLASPTKFFGEAVIGDDVYIFAFMTNGDYIDIFSYDMRDYRIDVSKLNFFCKTAQDGLMFCIERDRNFRYPHPSKMKA